MTFLRRTIIAAASVAVLGASFAALAQDIKPRMIRFGACRCGRATIPGCKVPLPISITYRPRPSGARLSGHYSFNVL